MFLSTFGVYKVQLKAPKKELCQSPRDNFVNGTGHAQASLVIMMSTVWLPADSDKAA